MIIDGIDISIDKTMQEIQDNLEILDKQIANVRIELVKNHEATIHNNYQKIYDRLIKNRAKCRDLKLSIILDKKLNNADIA